MGRLAARGLRSLPRLSTPPLLPQDRSVKGNRMTYGRYVRMRSLHGLCWIALWLTRSLASPENRLDPLRVWFRIPGI